MHVTDLSFSGYQEAAGLESPGWNRPVGIARLESLGWIRKVGIANDAQ